MGSLEEIFEFKEGFRTGLPGDDDALVVIRGRSYNVVPSPIISEETIEVCLFPQGAVRQDVCIILKADGETTFVWRNEGSALKGVPAEEVAIFAANAILNVVILFAEAEEAKAVPEKTGTKKKAKKK